jgi:hypothetical protein
VVVDDIERLSTVSGLVDRIECAGDVVGFV